MLIFLTCVLILHIGLDISHTNRRKKRHSAIGEILTAIGVTTSVACMFLIFLSVVNNSMDSEETMLQRQSYVDMCENGVFNQGINSFNIKVIEDIQKFNKCVRINKDYNKSLWIGCYVEDYWNYVEEIDIDKYIKTYQ